MVYELHAKYVVRTYSESFLKGKRIQLIANKKMSFQKKALYLFLTFSDTLYSCFQVSYMYSRGAPPLHLQTVLNSDDDMISVDKELPLPFFLPRNEPHFNSPVQSNIWMLYNVIYRTIGYRTPAHNYFL
jgi:hypothetical protein